MQPSWLLESDDTILQFLADTGLVATPKVITYNTDLSYSTVRNRIPILVERGLIQHPDDAPKGLKASGAYCLTEFGERYVSGDLTLQELREWVDNLDVE